MDTDGLFGLDRPFEIILLNISVEIWRIANYYI